MISGSDGLGARRLRRSVAAWVGGFSVWFSTQHPAHAQTPDPGTDIGGPAVAASDLDPQSRVLAREFAIRGAEAYEAGNYEVALENFNRATAILDVPSIAVMQGRTLVKLGRWLEGLDRLQQTARLELDASAPLPYKEAVGQATQEAEALRQQIPQVALLLAPQGPDDAREVSVEFDGNPVPKALVNIPLPVDPGQHRVRALVQGAPFFERQLDVALMQQIQIHIPPPPALQQRLAATVSLAPALGSGSPQPPSEVADASARSANWALYGALGATALGAAGAVTTAILGSADKATLANACDNQTRVCPQEYRGNISALNTERTLFYLSAGVAALAGGVATYLWLTDDSQPTHVALRVAPAALTLVGSY